MSVLGHINAMNKFSVFGLKMKKISVPMIFSVAMIYLILISCALHVAKDKLSSDECIEVSPVNSSEIEKISYGDILQPFFLYRI